MRSEETPALPRPSHAAFKLRKITCSSKLGRTGRKHGAHCSPGADQDRFPVNPRGYKGDFQSREQHSPFSPNRRRGLSSPLTRRRERERRRRWGCTALKKRGSLLEMNCSGLATRGQGQSCWHSPTPSTSLPNAAHTQSPKRPECRGLLPLPTPGLSQAQRAGNRAPPLTPAFSSLLREGREQPFYSCILAGSSGTSAPRVGWEKSPPGITRIGARFPAVFISQRW